MSEFWRGVASIKTYILVDRKYTLQAFGVQFITWNSLIAILILIFCRSDPKIDIAKLLYGKKYYFELAKQRLYLPSQKISRCLSYLHNQFVEDIPTSTMTQTSYCV